jgi:hypothetical protein
MPLEVLDKSKANAQPQGGDAFDICASGRLAGVGFDIGSVDVVD